MDLDSYFASMVPVRRISSQRLLACIESLAPKGAILDIGCSFGWFLDEAQARGWKTFGIEPSPIASEYARRRCQHQVRHGIFPEETFPGQVFDAVTMMDVLEHLDDPVGILKEVKRVLRPGGILAVKVPNCRGVVYEAASALFRLSGGAVSLPLWRLWQFDFPYPHLWYFNPPALRAALQSAGFDTEHEETEPIVTIRSIPKRLGYFLDSKSITSKAMLPVYTAGLAACASVAHITGRHDICLAVARHKS